MNPNKRHFCALYAALGMKATQIVEKLSISWATWDRWKKDPAFQTEVEQFKEEITQRLIDSKSNLEALFDFEAYSAFETLRDLHKTSEMDTVKLGAAKDILDRAPNAPKQRQERLEDHQHRIFIAGASFENLREALEDVGETDLIDLLPEDYEVEAEKSPDQLEVTRIEDLFE